MDISPDRFLIFFVLDTDRILWLLLSCSVVYVCLLLPNVNSVTDLSWRDRTGWDRTQLDGTGHDRAGQYTICNWSIIKSKVHIIFSPGTKFILPSGKFPLVKNLLNIIICCHQYMNQYLIIIYNIKVIKISSYIVTNLNTSSVRNITSIYYQSINVFSNQSKSAQWNISFTCIEE